MEHAGSGEGQDRISEINTLIAGALQYLQHKYGREFHALTFKESGFLGGEAELRVHTPDETDQTHTASVWISQEPGKEPLMKDDYFGVIIKPQYLAAVRGICKPLVQEAKIYCAGFQESFFHDDLGPKSGLDDAIALGQQLTGSLFIYAPVSEKRLEELARELEASMRARKLCGLVTLIVLKHEFSSQVDDSNYADTMRFYSDKTRELSNGIRSFLVSGEREAL